MIEICYDTLIQSYFLGRDPSGDEGLWYHHMEFAISTASKAFSVTFKALSAASEALSAASEALSAAFEAL